MNDLTISEKAEVLIDNIRSGIGVEPFYGDGNIYINLANKSLTSLQEYISNLENKNEELNNIINENFDKCYRVINICKMVDEHNWRDAIANIYTTVDLGIGIGLDDE